MFSKLNYLHSRPLRNGNKEILGIFLGPRFKWIRVYPSIIFNDKEAELIIDRNHIYLIPRSGSYTWENCHVGTHIAKTSQCIVFTIPEKMLYLRKVKIFEVWEKICGSFVRLWFTSPRLQKYYYAIIQGIVLKNLINGKHFCL